MLHPLTGQTIDPGADPDGEPIDERTAARIAGSDLLMAVGTGLFLVFLGYAIVDSLPFQLLNPNWQLRFVTRILSLGSIPLVGFACVHLAAILNPANVRMRQRLLMTRQWAMAAAIGFLLLIPLQGFATWKAYTEAKANQQTLIQQANRRVAPLKRVIESATSTADLQQKLSQLQGVQLRLAPEDLSRPLAVVQKSLIDNLVRSQNLYADRIASTTAPTQIWAALQSAARTLVASIGFFFGFAAGAQFGRSPLTLLDRMSVWSQSLFGGRRRRSRRP
ncbi:hypothetical protein KBZ08_00475 [Cyanobium sp. Candia 9D4]|uniref:hypothetical protein n=1 Tax=Cyanobium sp. Candia 9D4 TaxID=2823707 RepID=UPI0020CD48C6|nr:hypothetical protein [Cyanobium sp. Candia 9D4]MCP9932384.1 hypothetical protein [Cyanobium sp. Candia 9D4]